MENILKGLSPLQAELKIKELREHNINEKQIQQLINNYLSDFEKSKKGNKKK
jgi:hypothetical protein